MSQLKILIVDDEPEILRGLNLRLKANGYQVVSAADGMQATQVALREKPDLVILDIGLPAGNGHIVAERLRANASTMHIPIIILSARAGDSDYMEAMRIGVDKYLTKPYDADDLLAAIEECLNPV